MEQITETMLPSPKAITAAAMMASLLELLQFRVAVHRRVLNFEPISVS